MPTLYLVRHAKPAAGWGEDPDPGLDDTGVAQACRTAEELCARLQPVLLLTSPMRRCRETATALEGTWKSRAALFPAVAEIPAPSLELAERHRWLIAAMAGTWHQLQASAPPNSPDYLAWRRTLLEAVARITADSVIFTHYIAINAIVGASQRSENVICFRPDHASITTVSNDLQSLRVIELGREAITSVLTRG